MPLPSWPPKLTEEQLEELKLKATTYALAHGLSYLPPGENGQLPPYPSSATYAPFALFPTPFPRELFSRAEALQQIYNVLYSRIASDEEFVDSILSAETAVGRVDGFIGELWKIWKEVRSQKTTQTLQLGIYRSDYLIHDSGDKLELKQVEFNTMASSFGPMSQAVQGLHKYLLDSTGFYACAEVLKADNLPVTNTRSDVVQGFVHAHKAYLEVEKKKDSSNVYILFVIQPNERNVFDQRHLEYELIQNHGIRVVRRTFDELHKYGRLSDDNQKLMITINTSPHPIEISVVYFRAGYSPLDYPSHREFETRKMLERSRAIKCPSVGLHLAGSKKIQTILARPGVVESFLLRDHWRAIAKGNPHSFTSQAIDELRDSWMEMWCLEEEGGVAKARQMSSSLVLKPQREGGGNNVYKANIPPFLDRLPDHEREAWIAMALIHVPNNIQNYLMRSGEPVVKTKVASELGVYGWGVFGYENDDGEGGRKLRIDEGCGGYLLRTKGENMDEGGVATGFSVLDSMVLVD